MGIYLDNLLAVTVGDISRLCRFYDAAGITSPAFIYDVLDFEDAKKEDPETTPRDCMLAVVSIERITDGRGRFYQCDGKLIIDDVDFGAMEWPLVWKKSNLNRGGFWVILNSWGEYSRKIYRTPYGWRTFTDCKYMNNGGAMYEAQTHSAERRQGRGRRGVWDRLFAVAWFHDTLRDKIKNRKFFYRGEPTPFYKSLVKKMRRLKIGPYCEPITAAGGGNVPKVPPVKKGPGGQIAVV